MTIHIACSSCGHQYVLKDEVAGKKFACRKCQQSVRIPNSTGPVSPADVKTPFRKGASQDANDDEDKFEFAEDQSPSKSNALVEEENSYLQSPAVHKKKKKKSTSNGVDRLQWVGGNWGFGGVPFSIIVSLACQLSLLFWTFYLIYDNFIWNSVSGAVGQIVRVMWIVWIATEVHSGSRVGRWISIALGCLGFVWAFCMYEFVVPSVLASPVVTLKPWIVTKIYFSINLQICLWIVNVFSLFMPSAGRYCKGVG